MKRQFLRDPLTKEQWIEVISQAIKEGKIDLSYKSAVSINLSELVINEYAEKFNPPKLLIAASAYLKMMALVQATDKEIAWHGVVEQTEQGLYIKDILVYPQTTTAVTADADEESYPDWIIANREVLNNLRMQGHSHVNMQVFASGTDMDSFKKLMSQVKDYYIFLIVNKKWEIKVYYADVASGIFYEDVPLTIAVKDPFNLQEWTTTQLKNIKPKTYPSYAQGAQKYDGYFNPAYSAAMNAESTKTLTSPPNDDDDYKKVPLNKRYEREKAK